MKQRRILSFILMIAMIMTMGVFSVMNVSAAADDAAFDPSSANGEKISGLAAGNGTVLYTLKYDEEKFAGAKWYPVYGGMLDISKYIPKAGSDAFVIAFVDTSDYVDWTTGVTTDTAFKALIKPVPIPARAEAPDKKALQYDTIGQCIKGGLAATHEIKVGLSDWLTAVVAEHGTAAAGTVKAAAMGLGIDKFPLGGTIEVRVKATATIPASLAIKVKVPKQPKAPKVTLTESSKTWKGLKANLEFAISDDGVSADLAVASGSAWKTIDASAIKDIKTTEDLATALGGATVLDGKFLFIRVAPTEKKPASALTMIAVPAPPTP